MLSRFLHVWLIYWLAVVLLPVKSIHPATAEAFLPDFRVAVAVVAAYFVLSAK